jgi:hypothetical protein
MLGTSGKACRPPRGKMYPSVKGHLVTLAAARQVRPRSPRCEAATTQPVPSSNPHRRKRSLLLFSTAVSALLLLFFTASTIRWLLEPPSDVTTSDSYSFSYTTKALEHNTRYPNGRQTIDWNLLGFRLDLSRLVLYPRWISHGDNQTIEWGPVATWSVAVPGWACIALSAILPLRWVLIFRRRRREAKVAACICLCCGYDLRSSPERCPECGQIRPRPSSQAAGRAAT